MPDLSRIKTTKRKLNRFGEPLPATEKSDTLSQPEHAPAAPAKAAKSTKKARQKTGRTVAFGTRVSSKFLTEFKQVAFDSGLKLVDLLEASLEAYKKQKR